MLLLPLKILLRIELFLFIVITHKNPPNKQPKNFLFLVVEKSLMMQVMNKQQPYN
jgi:hypothetical protein